MEIAHFYEPEEAYCAKGYLRSFGIETIIQNEHHLTVNPMMRIALGGYPLLVVAGQAEEARQALAEISRQQHEPISRKRNWFWLPIALGSGVPFVPSRRSNGTPLLHLMFLALFYVGLFWSWAYYFISR